MQMSEKCDAVVGAFIKAQSSLKKAAKDTDNPFFKSKYADLNAVWAACQDALSENELAAIQDVQTTADGVTVSTRIVHSSGQWIECGPLTVPLGQKRDAQSVGSAITYGRRYGLSATLGVVADEDDDGNKATKDAPNPNEKITDAQVKELTALIDETGTDVPAFCQHFGWNSIKDIPAAHFSKAKHALETKKQRAAA